MVGRKASRRVACRVEWPRLFGGVCETGKADCPAGMMPNGEQPEAFLAALGRAGAWEMLPARLTARTPTPITGAPRTPAPGACTTLPTTVATAGDSESQTDGHTTAVRHRGAASMNLEDALICMHCRRANLGACRGRRISGSQPVCQSSDSPYDISGSARTRIA